jgi:FkbM family methyltransferase
MNIFLGPRFADSYARNPLLLVDVGARGGLKRDWAAARPHLRVLGFEPEQREFEKLAQGTTADDNSTRILNVALHSVQGPLEFHVARDRGLSSIFEPNRAFLDAFPDAARFDTTDTLQVPADTLDNILRLHGIADPDFIKVDTQGSELFVLRGASDALASSMVGVEVEVEFTPIYSGQPLFADVDSFMRGLGYLLFDLRPCYWKRAAGRAIGGPRGQIIWADALYLKSVGALRDAVMALPPALRRAKILKAISVALLYGYCDYALDIAQNSGDVLSADDRTAIEGSLKAVSSGAAAPLQALPGRRYLAAALYRLWKVFRQRDDSWSVSSPRLGNTG